VYFTLLDAFEVFDNFDHSQLIMLLLAEFELCFYVNNIIMTINWCRPTELFT